MKNESGILKTVKTNLELYRVVTGGYRWLQEPPRRKWWFFVTHKQTLHHNIYIIMVIIIIRFCALAGYGWSKWRGQELWGNCDGQKGRAKVISKSSIIGFVCWSEGFIKGDFFVVGFRISLWISWGSMSSYNVTISCNHTSYLSFFLHRQNFWRIKFTPKNA